MFEDGAGATDAPPHKPKQPFLKRGEGVNKRLNAYKLRDEAAGLRKQRSSSSSAKGEHYPAGSHDQLEHASSSNRHAGHQRRTWEQQLQQPQQAQSDDAEDTVCMSGYAAAAKAGGAIPATSASSHNNSWTGIQDVEDLELEEFRALEREILGDSKHSNTSTLGMQSQAQQQQPQQWGAADLQPNQQLQVQEIHDLEDMQANPRQQQQSQQQQEGDVPSKQVSADLAGLSNSVNLLDMDFQDDTEWVDTEFSFADLSLAAQQDQTHPAVQRKLQQQQHMLQQQKKQQQQQQQQEPDSSIAADTDTSDGPLAQQPYVRSIFRQQQQQQQQRRPLSGHRLGTAAGRGGARGGKPIPSIAAPSGTVHAGVTGSADAEQQMVAVPAAALVRWQQLESAHPSLQQEKAALRKMRQDLEKAAQQLEQQRAAWERDRAAQQASLEAWKAEETRQLANRRRVLDQQYKAMYKMPTKKDKSALEAIEAALEREKSEAKAAAARHKLTVERLRCQVKQLQDRNNELHEEVRWHEAQQLNSASFAVRDSSARKRPTCSAQTQTDSVLAQPPRASDKLLNQAGAWTAAAAAAAAAAGPPSAASSSNALYAALFGDDEDDEALSTELSPAQPTASGTVQPQQQLGSSTAGAATAGSVDWGAAAGSRTGPANSSQRSPGAGADGSCRPSPSNSSSVGQVAARWQQAETAASDGGLLQAQGGDTFSFTQAPDNHSSGQQQHQQKTASGCYQSNRTSKALRESSEGPTVAAAADGAAKMHSSGLSSAAAAPAAKRSSSSSRSSQAHFIVRREVLREYVHPDGKVEQLFDDGSREVHFVNGTIQVHRADGSTLVHFVNGDVKRQWGSGRVDYYYAEVSVWQCTHTDGQDVFYYPTGQVEGHFTDGRKEVIFADGAARIVAADGSEHDVTTAMLSPAVVEAPPDVHNL